MSKYFLSLVFTLYLFPSLAMSEVNFRVQTIKETLPQAKSEQKLIFSVCSSESCPPCKWMDANVYNDKRLSETINSQFLPIKPDAKSNRVEYFANCKVTPSMLFIDENGKVINKIEGKITLKEMKKAVSKVLSDNCTGMDENLDKASGTHKGNVCCEGLVKKTKDNELLCVKQYCVENSDLGIPFEGDPREAYPCCDESSKRNVIMNISGFLVHCVDQAMLKEVDHSNRGNSKPDFLPDSKKNDLDSAVFPY